MPFTPTASFLEHPFMNMCKDGYIMVPSVEGWNIVCSMQFKGALLIMASCNGRLSELVGLKWFRLQQQCAEKKKVGCQPQLRRHKTLPCLLDELLFSLSALNGSYTISLLVVGALKTARENIGIIILPHEILLPSLPQFTEILVSHDEICLSHVAMTIYAYWERSVTYGPSLLPSNQLLPALIRTLVIPMIATPNYNHVVTR